MPAAVQLLKCHFHWNGACYITLKAIVPGSENHFALLLFLSPVVPTSSLNKLSMVANSNDCYSTLTKEKENLSCLSQSGTTELTTSRDHIQAQK